MDLVFTNGRIVLRDEVRRGGLGVRDRLIADIHDGSAAPGAIDLDGDYLLPGLIEIHTDNLERHIQPRPGVIWPSPRAAAMAHDTQIAGAGITTVLDAVSVGEYRAGSGRRKMLTDTIASISDQAIRGLMRAEHLLHLRCELADAAVVEIYRSVADNPLVRVVSLMDHTPGQRQWAELSKYRLFHKEKKWTDEEFETHMADRRADQARYAVAHRGEVTALARAHGAVLASHDDTIPDHVDEAVADGIAISEFPTSIEAARHARTMGMRIVMGAPNVVRGGSHSGNVSALDLAQEGLLDGLSSDYVPSSLMQAAFGLHAGLGIALPETVAMVSANIADMLRFEDRGEVAFAKRADLVRVRDVDGLPVVRGVWREGRQVM